MAGRFGAMNKVRPDVYVNVVSEKKRQSGVSRRGRVAVALALPWGKEGAVTTVDVGDDTLTKFGYPLYSPQMSIINEILKNADTALVYRLNQGAKASGSLYSGVTVTAAYSGKRGNDIKVVVKQGTTRFTMTTYLGTKQVDIQSLEKLADYHPNGWIEITGTTANITDKTLALSGGTDGDVSAAQWDAALTAFEVERFNVFALTSPEDALKIKLVEFTKTLRETQGILFQTVMWQSYTADYEGIISVRNSPVLPNGDALSIAEAVAWAAGATAGSQMNESCVNKVYDGAVDVRPKLNNDQTIDELLRGQWIFSVKDNKVMVEDDINTLVTYTEEKSKDFRLNQVVRILDGIQDDLTRIYRADFIGKEQNDRTGRNLCKGATIDYLNTVQGMRAIEDFIGLEDVSIEMGADKPEVIAGIAVKPVVAMAIIYLTITAR